MECCVVFQIRCVYGCVFPYRELGVCCVCMRCGWVYVCVVCMVWGVCVFPSIFVQVCEYLPDQEYHGHQI